MKRISLGLQGGGAHGAFTWGVLEALLQDGRVEIAGISGTSAGALDGAALKSGLLEGGRDRALATLDWLWTQVGALTDPALAPWLEAVAPVAVSRAIEASLTFALADGVARVVSPYGSGPFYANPLRRIAEAFRYETVCAAEGPAFHICATNVRTGKIRVFSGAEISADTILASACLPTLFRAVEIDDPETGRREAYWDGGYSGNPALFPLFGAELPGDIVVVNINPLYRDALPVSAREIQNRINEISFNASLLRELRAIDFVQRLLDEGAVAEGAMKRLRLHMIADDALMGQLSVATKLVALPQVLHQLRRAGRAAAEGFLAAHYADLGTRASVDLRAMFG